MEEALAIATYLCKKYEGFSSKSYLCPANVWTIGFGSTRYPDGRAVSPQDSPVSIMEAEVILRYTLETNFLPGVLRASPELLKYPKALGAIVSFAYNLGVTAYRGSTLRRVIDEEDWGRAYEEINKWRMGGGRILPGLVKRRAEEATYLPT